MNGLGVALLIAAGGAAVLLLEHWRFGRQLERERAAGLHDGACTACGNLGECHADCPIGGGE